MYHRFNENKYPSTNINMNIFKSHIEIIKRNDFEFLEQNNIVIDDEEEEEIDDELDFSMF